ncbi:NACHT, LRR and PYD domains-containing protein 12-like [Erpetoichthys calabaricus]|uniref:NACHT, LRR and PYD domains-containing protein 12-like n=1 Tax=Erpetoichthys calabaricus TaxID=27687 RepID=UPI002234C158|nr:NACHT, LRR and PYD domains-containing protein 12-like [Erpetoichthys calabaricus]
MHSSQLSILNDLINSVRGHEFVWLLIQNKVLDCPLGSLDSLKDEAIVKRGLSSSGPYRAQLKLEAREIVESKWKNSRVLLAKYVKGLQFKYTPLVLVSDVSEVYPENKYKESRKQKCKRYIPKEDKLINIEDLLTMKEKKILLVGKPGIGKTFCVLQLLNLWAESNDDDALYIFYLDAEIVRHVRDSADLRSLLFCYCKPDRTIERDLLRDIENGNANMLIIFDSIDEIQQTSQDQKIERAIDRILKKYDLKKAKIIVTCRPSVEDHELPDWADCRVEVRGFGEKSISEYFKTTLEGQPIREEVVILYEKNINVFSLCHVPQYAFIVVCYMLNEGCMKLQQKISSVSTPSTVTELYVHIFRHCVGWHMLKVTHSKKGKVNKYIAENKEEIMILAKKAFNAILSKSVNLIDHHLEEIPCQSIKCCFLGSTSIDETLTSKKTCFAFLHNTMQEFFAAVWILENKNDISNIFQRSLTVGESHLKYVIYFLSGLFAKKNFKLMANLFQENSPEAISESLIRNIIKLIQSAEEDIGGEERILFAFQCLYEAQSTKACAQVLEAIDFEFCLEDEHIDPYQSRAVTYVVNEAIKETYSDLKMQDLLLFILGYKLLLECTESYRTWGKKKSNCCQRVLESGDQNIFLEMMKFEVYVSLHWYSETLRTLGRLINKSVKKVTVILDSSFSRDSQKTFVLIVSECLEKMASVRFSTGFDEKLFITMMELCQKYDEVTGDSSLYKFVHLFGPLPNTVDCKDTSWINQIDFSFLQKYLNRDIQEWHPYSKTLPDLDEFIISTLINISKNDRTCYSDIRQYIQQSRNVKLSDKEVFLSWRWNKVILNSMMNFVERPSTQVDIILDAIVYEMYDFICHVSNCLDKISSIRAERNGGRVLVSFKAVMAEVLRQRVCVASSRYQQIC